MRQAALALLLLAGPAAAEPLTGTLSDRQLREHTDVIYLEHVRGAFPPGEAPIQRLPHVLPVVRGTLVHQRPFQKLGPVHLPEINTWVIVVQNPYFTTSIDRKTGEFRINGVPPGAYTMRVWGERLSDAQNRRRFRVFVPAADPGPRLARLD
jgi:Polysaccharide lyase family 4, domain II